ncbi:MAG: phosphopyruvate hydratase [Thermoplasmata archaeon]
MSAVAEVTLRQIYDSRGHPTIEATVVSDAGALGRAGAPSGASTGTHEVRAFPDGGVGEALGRFGPAERRQLLGTPLEAQPEWDGKLREMDGTIDLSRLGGNTATALSLAYAQAGAIEADRPLWEVWRRPGITSKKFPFLVGNCLNGGKHAINGPEFQEFLAISTAAHPADALRAALEVHRRVGEALRARFPKAALGRGDEGGWVASVDSREGLEILSRACREARDELGLPVHPGLDLAASEFYSEGRYHYRTMSRTAEEQLQFLTDLVAEFDLKYVEDPFDQEDFESFARFTAEVKGRCMVVGDDLYTTNLKRLERGITARSSTSILIKVNQVGTLTDTFATIDRARAQGWSTVTSHRSGEVPESWLPHLAVASGAAGLKCGLLGGERIAKLNELLRLAGPTEH